MTLNIRQFTDADYPAFSQLKNTVYPEYASPVEMFRHWDNIKDPKCRAQRFLAGKEGELIGAGEYSQSPWTYHPQKYDVDFIVHPDYRRHGTGRALYARVVDALTPFKPQQLRSKAREDKGGGTAFLAQFGFVEVGREWESRLHPAGFDFSPYAGLEERITSGGIQITTLAALMKIDPAHQRKLFDLDWEASNDSQRDDEITRPTFEHYVESNFNAPGFLAEATFIAVKDGQYIGISSLESRGTKNELIVGFTGVLRPFRRRGIAMVLKLRTIQYANAHGNPELVTWNNSINRPMLAINERLGFIKQPAWISYRKELSYR